MKKFVGFRQLFTTILANLLNKNTISYVCLFLSCCILSGVSTIFLEDYQYDKLAFSINNYNLHTINDDDFDPTVLSIKPNENNKPPQVFNKAFNYFYYNKINGVIRNQAKNNVTFENLQLKLETQPTFSISKSAAVSPGYYIDYGLYSSYYMDEVLGDRGYLSYRFNCDTFIFVSDSFADKLVEIYDIKTEEPYKTLIEDERYCILDLNIDGIKSTKMCINNIIYSDKRTGGRTSYLYGDFALFYCNSRVNNLFDFEFDIELKDNPFLIKKTIRDIEKLEYISESFQIAFKTFDKSSRQYLYSDALGDLYANICERKNRDYLVYILLLLINSAYFLIIYFTSKYRKMSKNEKTAIVAFDALIFFTYGFIVTFVYNYFMFSITPIVLLIGTFICFWKEVTGCGKNSFNKQSVADVKTENSWFFNVEI